MGVKWLTSYVRSIQSLVSRSVQLDVAGKDVASSRGDQDTEDGVTFVVDGWAFIYHVYLGHFGDGVRALDYARFKAFIHAALDAWHAAGVDHIVFVLDGPMLPAKLPTILRRRAGVVGCNAAYMRASPVSRTSKRFQSDCGMVAPLLYHATVDALQEWKQTRRSSAAKLTRRASMDGKMNGSASHGKGKENNDDDVLEIIFAKTEADGLVAELAEERQGYALSIDSDYFILCARGNKSKGYIPLDELEYLVERDPEQAARDEEERAKAMAEAAAAAAAASALAGNDDDGFEQVSSRKSGRRRGGGGSTIAAPSLASIASSSRPVAIDSPEVEQGMRLRGIKLQAYSAHALAQQLQLPPSLMPLFAALCGNDYTPALQSSLLFRDLTGAQRMTAVASILRSEWNKVVSGAAPATLGAARLRRKAGAGLAGIDGRSEGASSATATPTTATPANATAATAAATRRGNAAASPMTATASTSNGSLDPVRAIVEAIVDSALTSSGPSRYISTGERDALADGIIDSLATYSLLTHADAPYLASPSARFFLLSSSSSSSSSSAEAKAATGTDVSGEDHHEEPQQQQQREEQHQALDAYRQAYARGQLKPVLVEAMTQRVFVAQFFAEDPDVTSVQVSNAARQLRAWLWAVLFDAWGMQWARESMDEPEEEEEEDGADNDSGSEDPDEVISVDTDTSEEEEEEEDEEDFDNLPTRPGSALDTHTGPTITAPVKKPPPAVVEYVRKGDHLASQVVPIISFVDMLAEENEGAEVSLPTSLADLLGRHRAASAAANTGSANSGSPLPDPRPPPVALLPLSVRMDLYLHAHGANTSSIRAVRPAEMRVAAAVLRLSITQHGATDPAKRRTNWTRREAAVAIRAAYIAHRRWTSIGNGSEASSLSDAAAAAAIVPSTRAIHLATTWQLLCENSYLLAQSLLLDGEAQDYEDAKSEESHVAKPHTLFHGPTFHILMAEQPQQQQQTSEEGEEQDESHEAPSVKTKSAKGTVEGLSMRKEEKEALEAALEGLDDLLGIDAETLKRQRLARKKKEKEEAAKEREAEREKLQKLERESAKTSNSKKGNSNNKRGAAAAAKAKTNAFALLAGVEDED